MLEAVKIWGDIGQSDSMACQEPQRLHVAEGECLIVYFPAKSPHGRVQAIAGLMKNLREELKWEGQILCLPDDIKMKVVTQDAAERLSKTAANVGAAADDLRKFRYPFQQIGESFADKDALTKAREAFYRPWVDDVTIPQSESSSEFLHQAAASGITRLGDTKDADTKASGCPKQSPDDAGDNRL